VFVGCRRGAGPEQAGPRVERHADRQRVHGQSSGSRARLRSLGLRPRKRLSQSFLEDQRVASAIVRAAKLDENKHVMEVGPGLGVLTRSLAKAAHKVVAVEIDADLADILQREALENLTVVNEDVLRVEPGSYFQQPYTVVANLPYHITSPAMRHLLSAGPPFAERLVVMVQAEVAERIAAEPGHMSALAVAIQAQADVTIVRRVPAEAFYPRPKVDSAILVLEPLEERAVQRHEMDEFVELVQAGFKQPRKTLANSLADGFDISKDEATQRLERAKIDPALRPQVLTVADWVRLFRSS
jgi:16S rRNA (adenine1518-N6/adenine1519-N6)-dimethyltransferase